MLAGGCLGLENAGRRVALAPALQGTSLTLGQDRLPLGVGPGCDGAQRVSSLPCVTH